MAIAKYFPSLSATRGVLGAAVAAVKFMAREPTNPDGINKLNRVLQGTAQLKFPIPNN